MSDSAKCERWIAALEGYSREDAIRAIKANPNAQSFDILLDWLATDSSYRQELQRISGEQNRQKERLAALSRRRPSAMTRRKKQGPEVFGHIPPAADETCSISPVVSPSYKSPAPDAASHLPPPYNIETLPEAGDNGYVVHSNETLLASLYPAITSIMETLGCSLDHAFNYLHKAKYNNALAIEAALEDNTEPPAPAERCPVCWSPFDDETPALTLPCGHSTCADCFIQHIRVQAGDGTLGEAVCPGYECVAPIPPVVAMATLPDDLKASYIAMITRTRVLVDPKAIICPGPDCALTVRKSRFTVVDAKCDCGHLFCTKCLREAHRPCSCYRVSEWEKMDQSDEGTKRWLQIHSKKCPRCGTMIEKDRGCNHMTCKLCRHEFCWMCQRPWELHTDFYHCSEYENNPAQYEDLEGQALEVDHAFYTHCWARFNNHRISEQLQAKFFADAKTRALSMTGEAHGVPHTSWYRRGVDTLKDARQYIKWTCVHSYFMAESNDKLLFSRLQGSLEHATEALSHTLERPLSEIKPEVALRQTDHLQQCLAAVVSWED
ncbi:IBR domain [Carpediemonas membranifera]|uniref:RBR-type E3 ubiquitin transferase n=1 Tax=Carpediemonas membranifera TaxID=201153 RepID=A0A8J6BVS8_9EUKA|nr:IBR domain [Carpediemonas membranifera]|eukprot:KAG9391716.1 IBR domain [Carpediemonas membranifera]